MVAPTDLQKIAKAILCRVCLDACVGQRYSCINEDPGGIIMKKGDYLSSFFHYYGGPKGIRTPGSALGKPRFIRLNYGAKKF